MEGVVKKLFQNGNHLEWKKHPVMNIKARLEALSEITVTWRTVQWTRSGRHLNWESWNLVQHNLSRVKLRALFNGRHEDFYLNTVGLFSLVMLLHLLCTFWWICELKTILWSTDNGHTDAKSLILLRPKFKSQSQINIWFVLSPFASINQIFIKINSFKVWLKRIHHFEKIPIH